MVDVPVDPRAQLSKASDDIEGTGLIQFILLKFI